VTSRQEVESDRTGSLRLGFVPTGNGRSVPAIIVQNLVCNLATIARLILRNHRRILILFIHAERKATLYKSRDNAVDDLGGQHASQLLFEAAVEVGQFAEVETHEMQDRGMEIMDSDWLLLGFVTELVAGADDLPALDPRAGHPQGHGAWVVVAAHAFLGNRHAAELAMPDDQRRVEEAASLQVGEQSGDWAIDRGGVAGVVVLDVVMRIPRVAVLLAEPAMINTGT